jgi:hypothetical protein
MVSDFVRKYDIVVGEKVCYFQVHDEAVEAETEARAE